MNDYIELRFNIDPCSETATDILAALLADAGCESFVPDDAGLTAYVDKRGYDSAMIETAVASMPIKCEIKAETPVTVEGRDWNEEWEKNYFKPIVIDNRCVIHSSFHTDIPVCDYDITIDPKMAFGTGHHATTSLIVEQLLSIDLNSKKFLDMGTGTGILAILAAMRGASPVTAIEIDPPAHANAVENVALNGHPEIDVLLGDASRLGGIGGVDVFVANINRNVITTDIADYSATLVPDAIVLLSGFYTEDIEIVVEAARKAGLTPSGHTERDNWACLRLKKHPII